MRTFSVLLIPLIVGQDGKSPQLSPEVIADTTESVVQYSFAERDRRGYVTGKGWAHSVAHTADALGACGLHPHTTGASVLKILETIGHLAAVPDALGHLEDDRLAYTAFSIIHANRVSTSEVEAWLDSFGLKEDARDDGEETRGGANMEHFLRSLYFRFLTADDSSPWLSKVEAVLSRFDIYQLWRIHA